MKRLKFLLVLMAVSAISLEVNAQKNRKMKNTEIVTTFLEGFNNPDQIQESMNLLADDYKFKNPMVTLNSKAEFMELAQQIGEILTGVNIIQVAGNGDWVAAYYEFTSKIPGVESNLATEWFRVEDGQIKESLLIYDASEWRKVYAQMEN